MGTAAELTGTGERAVGAPEARTSRDPEGAAAADGGHGADGAAGAGGPGGGPGPGGQEPWLVGTVKAPWRGLGLGLVSVLVSVPLFCLTLISICLIPVGIGLYTTPVLLGGLRHFADWRRSLVTRWGGVPLPRARRAHWAEGTGAPGRTLVLLGDPRTWRQLWWLITDMSAGALTALLPMGLITHGVYGYVLAAGVWEPIHEADGAPWYTFVQIHNQDDANLAALIGTGMLVLGLVAGRTLLRGHFAVTRGMLGDA